MTKFFAILNQRNFSLLTLVTIGLLAPPAWSQPQQPLFTPVTRPFVHSGEKKVDYGLLIRAMRQFLGEDRYLLESELTLKAKTPGASLNAVARIQTISEEPNQFRTKISFVNSAGKRGREYLLISNGKQVWTHDLNQNVYSVTDYQQFQNADDNFLSGMLSRLFSTIRSSAGEDNISLLVNVPEAKLIEILEAQFSANMAGLKTEIQRLEGAEYTTYSYLDQKKGYQMSAFINAWTSEIKYLQIASRNNQEFDVDVQEKVIHYTNPISVPANAFQFVPPQGSQLQTTPISLNPFMQ